VQLLVEEAVSMSSKASAKLHQCAVEQRTQKRRHHHDVPRWQLQCSSDGEEQDATQGPYDRFLAKLEEESSNPKKTQEFSMHQKWHAKWSFSKWHGFDVTVSNEKLSIG
jgi:hypothetical protein